MNSFEIFFFLKDKKVKNIIAIKKRWINLKCPKTFLNVNLSENEIWAISFPTNLFPPIDNGNWIYCWKNLLNGISVIKKNINNKKINITEPKKKYLNFLKFSLSKK